MLRHSWFPVVFLLAACPSKGAGTTTPTQAQAQPAGPGCPDASGVYVASYVTQDPGKGRSGWVMPLHAMQVEPGAEVSDYAQLDATAASVSGVPAAPSGTLWLATAGAAPCRVQLGSYYAAKIEGPPASLTYGVELDGCPAPADPQEAGGIVLVSDAAPTGCRFEVPRPVAARLGRPDAKPWQPPTTQTPVPPALAAAIPPHACESPGCERLWAVGEIDVGGRPVAWSAAFNYLQIGDPATPCAWTAERYSGFFVPGPSGTAVKIDEGQDHPLVLTAALVDATGAKALLAEGPGQYATYDLMPGGARLGHHVTWMLAPADAWEAVDHLGPICEPPAAQPAPLPKDAKPISPYR